MRWSGLPLEPARKAKMSKCERHGESGDKNLWDAMAQDVKDCFMTQLAKVPRRVPPPLRRWRSSSQWSAESLRNDWCFGFLSQGVRGVEWTIN
jgi:hypothetical protein